MKMADCIVWLNKGHSVPRRDVTPAEAALLTVQHHVNVGSNPVTHFTNEREIQRSNLEEKNRLVGLFGKKLVGLVFPGGMPQLPADFEEGVAVGVGMVMPESSGFVNGAPPPPTGEEVSGRPARGTGEE